MTIAASITDRERTPAWKSGAEVEVLHKSFSRRFFGTCNTDMPWGSFVDEVTDTTLDEFLRQAHYAAVADRHSVVKAPGGRYPFERGGAIRIAEETSPGHYVVFCLVERPKATELVEHAPRRIVTVQGRRMDAFVLPPPNERKLP